MNLSINLIIVSVFSLIAIGYLIGFFSSFLSCKKHIDNVEDLSLDSLSYYVKLVSSLTGKNFDLQNTIDSLTDECLNQKEKIDDLTAQIADMKIVRLGTETSKILTDNLEKNKDFLDGISKN